jgi:two-component sensor histidine kinase
VFVLGYAYRTPLLYGSRAIPIAATAALGSLLLSIGAVATAGPSHWPLRALAGVSARARLLRTFVPLTVFVVIASFIVHDQADALGHLNHALLASMLGTASALTAGIVVSRVAQAIGESLDRAQLARQQAERALAQQERARAELAETLNVEISHRVKNNLATAAGLLQMQVAGQSDPQVVGMLQDTIARLYAFANVHEQLVATLGAEIELLGALRKIADSIQSVFPRENVAVSVEGGEIACPAKTATALCLVVNELMTNAIKHGAPGSEGQLEVAVRLAREAGKLELSVWNSGNPVPAGLDPSKQRGMGLSLVQGLVGQYRGSFALQPDNGGSLARVVLSEEVLWGSP